MNDNQKFIPLSLSKTLTSPSPFIPLSVTYPETKFEPLTKENWEEMKKKNSKNQKQYKKFELIIYQFFKDWLTLFFVNEEEDGG